MAHCDETMELSQTPEPVWEWNEQNKANQNRNEAIMNSLIVLNGKWWCVYAQTLII